MLKLFKQAAKPSPSPLKERFFALSPTFLTFKYSLFVPWIDSPHIGTLTPCPSHTTHCFSFLSSSVMVPELEKPRVTEIQVRMDCNGCVQKIKKALLGISGVYELYIDFPQQKITIIGCADPEKIVKAIKKTRKTAIICSHTEPQAQPSDPDNQGEAAPQESANPPQQESATPPPSEGPPTEEASPAEAPPAEAPKDPPPPAESPKPDAAEAPASKPVQSSGPKDVEEVHVIYHHPPDFGYRYGYNPSMSSPNMGQGYISGYWHSYPTGPVFRPEPLAPVPAPPPPPTYVTHSYNTHRASPYVTGYEYTRPPPQYSHYTRPESYQQPQYSVHYSRPAESYPLPPQYTHYSRPERYREDYHYGNNGNGNITSVFSDENPNACRIV